MRRTTRIRPTVVACTVLGAVALAGCGAGQVSQTAGQVSAVNGANVTAGDIAVRNAEFTLGEEIEAAVAHRRGSDAPLELYVVNTGNQADELLSVSSPVAAGAEITGQRIIPGGQQLVVEAPEPAAAVPPVGAPGATAGVIPGPSGVVPTTAAVPPTGTPPGTEPTAAVPTSTTGATASAPAPAAVGPGENTAQITLTGLRDDIRSGLTYEVVFTFRNAGEVRVPMPVATAEEPRESEAE